MENPKEWTEKTSNTSYWNTIYNFIVLANVTLHLFIDILKGYGVETERKSNPSIHLNNWNNLRELNYFIFFCCFHRLYFSWVISSRLSLVRCLTFTSLMIFATVFITEHHNFMNRDGINTEELLQRLNCCCSCGCLRFII